MRLALRRSGNYDAPLVPRRDVSPAREHHPPHSAVVNGGVFTHTVTDGGWPAPCTLAPRFSVTAREVLMHRRVSNGLSSPSPGLGRGLAVLAIAPRCSHVPRLPEKRSGDRPRRKRRTAPISA